MLGVLKSDGWNNIDGLAPFGTLDRKLNRALYLGEKCVVLADTDVITGMEFRTALANNDAAC